MEGKIEVKEIEAQPVLGMRFRTSMAKIGEDIGRGYGALFGYLGELGEPPAGPPFALYYGEEFDPDDIDMEVCAPTSRVLEGKGDIEARELPSGLVVYVVHKGPYSELAATYQALDVWIGENGYKYAGPAKEIYLNDPSETPASELLTEIQYPVAR